MQQDSAKRIRASGIELKLFFVATKLESLVRFRLESVLTKDEKDRA